MIQLVSALAPLILLATPAAALDGGDNAAATVQMHLDHVWTMVAAALVLMMQVGFLLLEAGLVRSKNSINVAQKNIADLIVSIACFWLLGFMIMFAPTAGGFLGFDTGLIALDQRPDWDFTFFVFQAVFCGTAATIMSGAVAERFAFTGYITVTLAIALLIYPVFGHWAWGNLLIADNPAYLADKGFIDFAGSTVVHSVGAWVALAIVVVIGPRLGRFNETGKPIEIQGHSPVLSASGAVILFVGWIGFNGGSTTAGTPAVAHIVANTVVAAAFGGLAALIYGWVQDGVLKPDRSINGLLGGLVAITAGCDILTAHSAAFLGAIGGVVALASHDFLLRRCRIDDVVGAVGVHGFAGAVGTLAIAFMAPADALGAGSRWQQFLVQGEGVVLAFVWSFGVTFGVLKVMSLFVSPRVSQEHEFEGLNRAEHGATLGTGHLQLALLELLRGKSDFSTRVDVEPGDEAAELSCLFNQLLGRMERSANGERLKEEARHDDLEKQREKERQIVDEISKVIESAAQGDLDQRVELSGKVGALRAAGEGVNNLLDAMKDVTQDLREALVGMSSGDLSHRVRADRGGQFGSMAHSFNRTAAMLSQSVLDIASEARDLDGYANGLTKSSSELGQMIADQRQASAETSENVGLARESLIKSREHSMETAQLASQSHGAACEGQSLLGSMVEKIQAANETARRALSIVEIIEEIARQTNILAINASVEAARAQEHGKGFAIIAQEVRTLAARVAESSQEISEIISGNFALMEGVTASVDRIRDGLERIETGADTTARAVESMGESLADDVARMEMVYQAMVDVNEISNKVATLSEHNGEISSAVDQTSTQLKKFTELFDVNLAKDRNEMEKRAQAKQQATSRMRQLTKA